MLKHLLFLSISLTLFACTDSGNNATSLNKLPKDFNEMEYVQIHRNLRYSQVTSYIREYNKKVDETLTREQLVEDSVRFDVDTASIHRFFTDRMTGAFQNCDHSESFVCEDFTDEEREEEWRWRWTPDTIYTYTENPNSLYGVDTTYELNYKTSLDARSMRIIRGFNFHDRLDDWNAVREIPLDTTAIHNHFLSVAKNKGWPYRYCNEYEAEGQPVFPEPPAEKLYCLDGQDVKETHNNH